jgi:cytoskeletal protein CcmA (bactofilin family)
MKLVKESGVDTASGLIGKGVEVTGDILFTDGLRVEGRVNGSLVSEKGTLVVEESARVEARVDVGVCLISGTLEGNVKAKSRVEIRRTSRVRGDIITPVLLVEEGSVLNGNVGMSAEAAGRLIDATPREGEGEESILVKGA